MRILGSQNQLNSTPRNSGTYIIAHPLGPGGIVMVISPDGPRLSDLFRPDQDFSRALLNHAAQYCAFWNKPCPWLDELFYKGDLTPTPEGIHKTADLSLAVIQALAKGDDIRKFPKFYLTK